MLDILTEISNEGQESDWNNMCYRISEDCWGHGVAAQCHWQMSATTDSNENSN